jgi:hypothetical protein
MREILLGEVRLDFPECFEECSGELMIKLAKLGSFFKKPEELASDKLKEYAVWVMALEAVVNAAWVKPNSRASKRFWKKLKLAPEQLEYLIETLQWVKDRPDGMPFEHFEHFGVRYLLPQERFKHTTSIEWTEGLLDFVELTATANQQDEAGALDRLDCLIANFCRPERKDLEAWKESEGYNGDVREPYNRAKAEERAKVFKDLDAGVKILVLWWYEELIRGFFEEYKELFGKGDTKNKRYNDGRGFLMVLKNAAKKHYLGDFNRVCDNDVNVVYSLLLDDFFDENESPPTGTPDRPKGGEVDD